MPENIVQEVKDTIQDFRNKWQGHFDGIPIDRIRKNFGNDGFEAVFRFLYEDRWPEMALSKPAQEFEIKHGFKGLSHEYILPTGLTCNDLQSYTMILEYQEKKAGLSVQEYLDKMENLFLAIAEKNPELKDLRYKKIKSNDLYGNNRCELDDFIMGVASAFCLDDIKMCLNSENWPTFSHVDEALKERNKTHPGIYSLTKEMEKLYTDMEWTTSIPTLKKIKEQTDAKISIASKTVRKILNKFSF